MGLTVLADDLTGACDTAALFAGSAGALVLLGIDALGADPAPASEVLALDTESRSLAPEDAAARLRAAAPWVAERLRAGRLYKKVDSTMRGPVGAEIEAVLSVGGVAAALVCPAFPDQRRTVVNGILLVDGVPVRDSAVGGDPDYRVTTSDLALLLAAQTTRPVSRVALEVVRGPAAELDRALAGPPGRLMVADAETVADLEALARAALARREIVPVGSAGLAGPLARALGIPEAPVTLPGGRAWLFVVGSLHPAARAQLAALRAAGIAGTDTPGVGPVVEALRHGHPAFLASPAERRHGAQGSRQAAATALARATSEVLEHVDPDLVVVTGGETAWALARALGAHHLRLDGAPASGLASGRVVLSGERALPVLTKAGGFGSPDLFITLLRGTPQ
jgi:uncharacterized protein YgbK (DUF1537 family)